MINKFRLLTCIILFAASFYLRFKFVYCTLGHTASPLLRCDQKSLQVFFPEEFFNYDLKTEFNSSFELPPESKFVNDEVIINKRKNCAADRYANHEFSNGCRGSLRHIRDTLYSAEGFYDEVSTEDCREFENSNGFVSVIGFQNPLDHQQSLQVKCVCLFSSGSPCKAALAPGASSGACNGNNEANFKQDRLVWQGKREDFLAGREAELIASLLSKEDEDYEPLLSVLLKNYYNQLISASVVGVASSKKNGNFASQGFETPRVIFQTTVHALPQRFALPKTCSLALGNETVMLVEDGCPTSADWDMRTDSADSFVDKDGMVVNVVTLSFALDGLVFGDGILDPSMSSFNVPDSIALGLSCELDLYRATARSYNDLHLNQLCRQNSSPSSFQKKTDTNQEILPTFEEIVEAEQLYEESLVESLDALQNPVLDSHLNVKEDSKFSSALLEAERVAMLRRQTNVENPWVVIKRWTRTFDSVVVEKLIKRDSMNSDWSFSDSKQTRLSSEFRRRNFIPSIRSSTEDAKVYSIFGAGRTGRRIAVPVIEQEIEMNSGHVLEEPSLEEIEVNDFFVREQVRSMVNRHMLLRRGYTPLFRSSSLTPQQTVEWQDVGEETEQIDAAPSSNSWRAIMTKASLNAAPVPIEQRPSPRIHDEETPSHSWRLIAEQHGEPNTHETSALAPSLLEASVIDNSFRKKKRRLRRLQRTDSVFQLREFIPVQNLTRIAEMEAMYIERAREEHSEKKLIEEKLRTGEISEAMLKDLALANRDVDSTAAVDTLQAPPVINVSAFKDAVLGQSRDTKRTEQLNVLTPPGSTEVVLTSERPKTRSQAGLLGLGIGENVPASESSIYRGKVEVSYGPWTTAWSRNQLERTTEGEVGNSLGFVEAGISGVQKEVGFSTGWRNLVQSVSFNEIRQELGVGLAIGDYGVHVDRSQSFEAVAVEVIARGFTHGTLVDFVDRSVGQRFRIRDFEISIQHDFDDYFFITDPGFGTEVMVKWKDLSVIVASDVAEKRAGVGFGVRGYNVAVLHDFDQFMTIAQANWRRGWQIAIETDFADEFSTANFINIGAGKLSRLFFQLGAGVGDDGVPQATIRLQSRNVGIGIDFLNEFGERVFEYSITVGRFTYVWQSNIELLNIKVPNILGVQAGELEKLILSFLPRKIPA